MDDPHLPTSDEMLVAALNQRIAEVRTARQTAIDTIPALHAKKSAHGYHPHYPGYITGGMFLDRGFSAGNILAVLGIHALDWREVLDRLAEAPFASDADEVDLLSRLRVACEADPMLEIAGEQLAEESGLLKNGGIDPFWLKRPKFGLGQVAMVFKLEPQHADGHRGLYALRPAVLRRGFERVTIEQADQRFGAMLAPVIDTGSELLAKIGAAAFHRDAEARYHDDCVRFAEHQRANPDRRWRSKPPLSRQGHLAVATTRATGVLLPTKCTRGQAATWLSEHDANIRFAKPEA